MDVEFKKKIYSRNSKETNYFTTANYNIFPFQFTYELVILPRKCDSRFNEKTESNVI